MMENQLLKLLMSLKQARLYISFDARSKKGNYFPAIFLQTHGNQYGIHELATALATIDDQVVYPTLTVLGTDYYTSETLPT
jgi:hypothetical protein